jgi:hypothetical protein
MGWGPRRLFAGLLWLFLWAPPLAWAQLPPQVPRGAQLQLQVAQPQVDTTSPFVATAEFDPPRIRPGEKTVLRMNINATESSIQWPKDFPLPPGLGTARPARGQITEMQVNTFRPLTSFVYEVRPVTAGQFTVPGFTVEVSGSLVPVPSATLEVSAAAPATPPPRQLGLEISETNLYLGQPFRVRVFLPAGPGNQIEALRELELDGDGLMIDKTAIEQSIGPVAVDGQLRSAFIAQMIVTPISAGPLRFTAKGFTAGREFTAPISISGPVNLAGGPPKYVLLVSEPVAINVRPLPVEGELPGFTGAMGRFFCDPPRLSTNRLSVGEPVRLELTVHGEGDLSRLAPPVAPPSRDWEIIQDSPAGTSFTLIPLTDDIHETPAIPYSYFDPETGKYGDLTIPPLPVTVLGEGLPAEVAAVDEPGAAAPPLKLSALATAPGKAMAGLKPVQLRAWFVAVQLAPVALFLALWRLDRHRRFLEAHPELVLRARARRALRREKHELRKAAAAGDAEGFVRHAARAMSIAVAPQVAADPQALVGGDVLAQLEPSARASNAGESVKQVFAAVDAQFALVPKAVPEVATVRPGVEAALQQLEDKL